MEGELPIWWRPSAPRRLATRGWGSSEGAWKLERREVLLEVKRRLVGNLEIRRWTKSICWNVWWTGLWRDRAWDWSGWGLVMDFKKRLDRR